MNRVGSLRPPASILLGLSLAAAMAAFAFFPSPVTGVLFAASLIVGGVVPEAGLFAIVLTIFTLPLIEGVGPVRDLRVDELMALSVILGAGRHWVRARRLPPAEITVPFLAFVVVAVASILLRMVLGADVNPRDFAAPQAKQLLRLALFLVTVWLVVRTPTTVRRLRSVLVGAGNAGAALGLAQVMYEPVTAFIVRNYLALHGGEPKVFYGDRAYGAFDGNPNHFGLAMVFVAVLALARSAEVKERRPKLAWFASALMPMFAVVASGSRADYVILGGTLLILSAVRRDVWIGALVGFVLYTLIVPNAFAWRIKVLFLEQNGSLAPGTSLSGKIQALGGSSFASSMVITDNFYLDVLYNFWPVALGIFIWFLYRGIRRLWIERDVEREHRSIVLATLVAWIVTAIASVQGPFFAVSRVIEVFWLLSGLAWGLFALPVRTLASDSHVGETSGDDGLSVEGVPAIEEDARPTHH